jgi:hypothetical protein
MNGTTRATAQPEQKARTRAQQVPPTHRASARPPGGREK